MSEQPYRSPIIPSMSDFFGVDDFEIFDEQQQAEGYIAGTILARRIHKELLGEEFEGKSRTYREAVLNAIREQV